MRWTILHDKYSTNDLVTCRCSCGTERLVHRKNVLSGRSKSCGCLQREQWEPKKRFSGKYKINAETGCWEWVSTFSKGYGQIRMSGKYLYAHRVAYELFKGPITDGLLVCHKCDNPRCVNPEHLFLGTHRDNVVDSINKGRFKHIENLEKASSSKKALRYEQNYSTIQTVVSTAIHHTDKEQ